MVSPNIIGWLAGWRFHSQGSVDITYLSKSNLGTKMKMGGVGGGGFGACGSMLVKQSMQPLQIKLLTAVMLHAQGIQYKTATTQTTKWLTPSSRSALPTGLGKTACSCHCCLSSPWIAASGNPARRCWMTPYIEKPGSRSRPRAQCAAIQQPWPHS